MKDDWQIERSWRKQGWGIGLAVLIFTIWIIALMVGLLVWASEIIWNHL